MIFIDDDGTDVSKENVSQILMATVSSNTGFVLSTYHCRRERVLTTIWGRPQLFPEPVRIDEVEDDPVMEPQTTFFFDLDGGQLRIHFHQDMTNGGARVW